jgi:hypothetical protein
MWTVDIRSSSNYCQKRPSEKHFSGSILCILFIYTCWQVFLSTQRRLSLSTICVQHLDFYRSKLFAMDWIESTSSNNPCSTIITLYVLFTLRHNNVCPYFQGNHSSPTVITPCYNILPLHYFTPPRSLLHIIIFTYSQAWPTTTRRNWCYHIIMYDRSLPPSGYNIFHTF